MYINNKPIAILLAAYNCEKYLEVQLDSIINQSNTQWKLYIRDDGSDDSTQSIIEHYTTLYPNTIIQVDPDGNNLGCSGNFYKLLEIVESRYYMFCDADDYWLPNKIEVLYAEIKQFEIYNQDIPLQVFSDLSICDSEMKMLEYSRWKSAGINPDKFLKYNYMAVCCTAGGACSIYNHLMKKMIFPLQNNNIIYDFWIAINIAKLGKAKPIHKPLLKYRQHGEQIYGVTYGEQNKLSYKLKKINKLIKQYRWEAQHHKDFGYGPKAKYYLYKLLTILKIRIGKYN